MKLLMFFSLILINKNKDSICLNNELLLLKYNNHEWKIEKMFISFNNFNS